MAVNATKKLPFEILSLNDHTDQTKKVKIEPPSGFCEDSNLKLRLLSAEMRAGMVSVLPY
jgi:hypothetical protein